MKKEYDLKKMKVKRRGAAVPGDAKVMKTIRLDIDVLAWLMTEADHRGIGYQTLINMLLKENMRQGSAKSLREEIRQIVKEEIKKAS